MRREELESDCCVADTEQHVSCVNVSFTSRLPEPQREEKRGDGLLQEREGGEQLNLLLTNTTTNFSSPPSLFLLTHLVPASSLLEISLPLLLSWYLPPVSICFIGETCKYMSRLIFFALLSNLRQIAEHISCLCQFNNSQIICNVSASNLSQC